MVMVHPSVEPKACWEFEGDILILHHPTTISVKYQAMGNLLFVAVSFVLHMSSYATVFQALDIFAGTVQYFDSTTILSDVLRRLLKLYLHSLIYSFR